jgi:hypothetical protein
MSLAIEDNPQQKTLFSCFKRLQLQWGKDEPSACQAAFWNGAHA